MFLHLYYFILILYQLIFLNLIYSGEIWRTEGILGFFGGLVPRLIGEVMTIFIANFLTEAFRQMIAQINKDTSEVGDFSEQMGILCVNSNGLSLFLGL